MSDVGLAIILMAVSVLMGTSFGVVTSCGPTVNGETDSTSPITDLEHSHNLNNASKTVTTISGLSVQDSNSASMLDNLVAYYSRFVFSTDGIALTVQERLQVSQPM